MQQYLPMNLLGFRVSLQRMQQQYPQCKQFMTYRLLLIQNATKRLAQWNPERYRFFRRILSTIMIGVQASLRFLRGFSFRIFFYNLPTNHTDLMARAGFLRRTRDLLYRFSAISCYLYY
jgi:hypothetical protein